MIYAACLPILFAPLSFKEGSIIYIIKYKSPLPRPIIAELVMHELEDISL
jgi:hypothetical protein